MSDNFFISMCSEGTKVSHKRWISLTVAAMLCWCDWYSMVHASSDNARQAVIVANMFFIAVMVGVATLPQIVSLVRGGNVPTATPEPTPTTDQPTGTKPE
jgi:hypothetical protein